jgi:hypothetical protein
VGILRHINIDKSELTYEERQEWIREEEHRQYIDREYGNIIPEVWEEDDEHFNWDD